MNRTSTAITIIAVAVLTNAGFTALGSVFDYPDVLKEPTTEILSAFRAHQGSVVAWFAVLAIAAALFAPIAIGVGTLRRDRRMRISVRVGIAAAIVQTIGLARWPLLAPSFAHDATSADPSTAAAAADHFHTAHVLLGNVVGETCGYVLTALWTVLVVSSLTREFAGRAFVALGAASAGMIVLGVLSPLDLAVVDTVNFAGYVLWSVWLLWLAVRILRTREGAAARARHRDPQPRAT